MTDLTARAEEEVAKILEKAPSYVRFAVVCDLGAIDDPQTLNEVRAVALAVRLMRYKLQVREAEKEMEERKQGLEAITDAGESTIGYTIALSASETARTMLAILTKHTQEEQ